MTTTHRPAILVADDDAGELAILREQLHHRYEVRAVGSGGEALAAVRQGPRVDLVLVAADMPGMDGYSVIQELKSNFLTADIPVVFLVAHGQESRALRAGAADAVPRGSEPEILLTRLDNLLQLRHARTLLRDQGSHVEFVVAERTRELEQIQDATVIAMASLARTRENDTSNRIRRTQHLVAALARELRFHPRFSAELTDRNISLLYKAAPLHDIGKVAVPDHILLKPGKLTEEEFETMKMHTVYGRDAIAGVEKMLGGSTPFLRYASDFAYCSREKWDGTGYPQGLKGDEIPIAARILAVADVYDALISTRPYRPAFTHETAMELVRMGRDEQFDPEVVDAMIAIEEKIKAISQQFSELDN
jgi:putative two-component system response regulator